MLLFLVAELLLVSLFIRRIWGPALGPVSKLARARLLPPATNQVKKTKDKQEKAPGGGERGASAIQPTSFVGKGGVRGGGG